MKFWIPLPDTIISWIFKLDDYNQLQEPVDLATKRMLGPQLQYFVNCMLSKFNFKNRVSVRALKFFADSQLLLGELVKAEETLETAQNIAFQCFNPTDMDLYDILRNRVNVLSGYNYYQHFLMNWNR